LALEHQNSEIDFCCGLSQVKPKSGLSNGADAKVRDFLRGQFPDGNITAAFTRLDLDGDSRQA
jgi:hypothetical protein